MTKVKGKQITEFYSVYKTKKGWRVWDTKNNVEGEPHQPVDYKTEAIAIIVAESLQHLC